MKNVMMIMMTLLSGFSYAQSLQDEMLEMMKRHEQLMDKAFKDFDLGGSFQETEPYAINDYRDGDKRVIEITPKSKNVDLEVTKVNGGIKITAESKKEVSEESGQGRSQSYSMSSSSRLIGLGPDVEPKIENHGDKIVVSFDAKRGILKKQSGVDLIELDDKGREI